MRELYLSLASFVLVESGLLDGREASTTWWLAPLFRQRYPGVRLDAQRMVAGSGQFVTAVAENLGQAFSMDAAADALATSKRTLARRLQEAAGKTPVNYVQDYASSARCFY